MVHMMVHPSSRHDAGMGTVLNHSGPVTPNGCPPWNTAWMTTWMTARGGMGAASRAVGAPFVTVAGTRVCSDVVLQSLDFRKALNTIGSGNVRVIKVVELLMGTVH